MATLRADGEELGAPSLPRSPRSRAGQHLGEAFGAVDPVRANRRLRRRRRAVSDRTHDGGVLVERRIVHRTNEGRVHELVSIDLRTHEIVQGLKPMGRAGADERIVEAIVKLEELLEVVRLPAAELLEGNPRAARS